MAVANAHKRCSTDEDGGLRKKSGGEDVRKWMIKREFGERLLTGVSRQMKQWRERTGVCKRAEESGEGGRM